MGEGSTFHSIFAFDENKSSSTDLLLSSLFLEIANNYPYLSSCKP